jgi:hypothetical protein
MEMLLWKNWGISAKKGYFPEHKKEIPLNGF